MNPPSTPEDLGRARKEREAGNPEAQAKILRTARAYQAVFGVEGERSEVQKIVMEDLRDNSGSRYTRVFRDDSGRVDANNQLIDVGTRQIFTHILGRIEQARNPIGEEPKT